MGAKPNFPGRLPGGVRPAVAATLSLLSFVAGAIVMWIAVPTADDPLPPRSTVTVDAELRTPAPRAPSTPSTPRTPGPARLQGPRRSSPVATPAPGAPVEAPEVGSDVAAPIVDTAVPEGAAPRPVDHELVRSATYEMFQRQLDALDTMLDDPDLTPERAQTLREIRASVETLASSVE